MTLITWGIVMSLSFQTATPAGHVPPGASAFYVSEAPDIVNARRLVQAGRLKDAEGVLSGHVKAEDPALRQASVEGMEIIRRIRMDYSASESDLLSRLKGPIPGLSASELQQWQQAGQVQARTLDGKLYYFRREPSNIFRFCNEAIQRRKAAGKGPAADPDGSAKHLVPFLTKVVAAARESRDGIVMPMRHHVTYTVTVKPDRKGAKSGSVVRCWLPYPQEYRQQGEIRLISSDPPDAHISPNALDGAKVRPNAQRTLYLERIITRPQDPITFREEFEFVCSSYYPKLSDADVQPLSRTDFAAELAERPPHILFTPEIRAAVKEAVGDESNPLRKLRRIYHWISEHVRYCAEEEYTIIPSFSQKVITTRKGDCGIQSTLLMTMCRVAGIPARWQSGWETKPWGFNMHDWAEVYLDPWGWVPVDMSYGLQPSDDPAVREFYIGHLDSYRMIVNLDYGSPLIPPTTALRSEPADFQRGEVEIDGRNLYFDEWDYDMKFETELVPGGGARQ